MVAVGVGPYVLTKYGERDETFWSAPVRVRPGRRAVELDAERWTVVNKERLERYSLAGPENQAAVSAGLTSGDWFRSAVPRKRMKELMRRSDHPAIRDTIIWLGLMALFAGLGIAFWGSWWAVPFFLAYGLLYGSTSDSRWHEAGQPAVRIGVGHLAAPVRPQAQHPAVRGRAGELTPAWRFVTEGVHSPLDGPRAGPIRDRLGQFVHG